VITVIDDRGFKTEIRDVPIGECFVYDGDLYLKLGDNNKNIFRDDMDYPCAHLESGTVYVFQMYERVEVVHDLELVMCRR